MKPWLEPGYAEPGEKEHIVSQEQMEVIHKEALCINCGCCVSECNSMESDPEFFGPAALAKGMRFVGDARDQADDRAARALQRRARDLGLHALLLLHRALPEGRRPARRDREARRRGDEARHRPRHGREAREVVRQVGGDDRLAARDGARAEDAGHRLARSSRSKFAMGLREEGKVPLPFPPHVAKDVAEARALHDLVREQGRDGALGIVQGEKAIERIEFAERPDAQARSPERAGEERGDEARRVLQGLPRVAVREGARHLDAGARAQARARAGRARVGHVLRRRRHPRGRARLLPAPERPHPRLRGADRLGHADDDLQRLHAQPPAGELAAEERRRRSASA